MWLRGIIDYSFSCLMWGVLIAFICTVIFVFILKGWRRDTMFYLDLPNRWNTVCIYGLSVYNVGWLYKTYKYS